VRSAPLGTPRTASRIRGSGCRRAHHTDNSEYEPPPPRSLFGVPHQGLFPLQTRWPLRRCFRPRSRSLQRPPSRRPSLCGIPPPFVVLDLFRAGALSRCVCLCVIRVNLSILTRAGPHIGLYKIFVHFEAVVHESIILLLPRLTCIAHTIALTFTQLVCHILSTPNTPWCMPYTIQHWQRQYRVKPTLHVEYAER